MTTQMMMKLQLLLLLVSAYQQVEKIHGASWHLRWSPKASEVGLHAFEGVEDDRAHTDPGVKHIYVEGDHYRFDMPLKERDSHPDRQRNEVSGMADAGGKSINITKGKRWMLEHRLYIPSSLKATTSFTHIMQLLPIGQGAVGPIFTISLQKRTGNNRTIELEIFTTKKVIGSTSLEPLQNSWIHSSIDFTSGDKGRLRWTLKDSKNATVVDSNVQDVSIWAALAIRVRPKWGIYRSVSDTADLEKCSMLVKDLMAWQFTSPNYTPGQQGALGWGTGPQEPTSTKNLDV